MEMYAIKNTGLLNLLYFAAADLYAGEEQSSNEPGCGCVGDGQIDQSHAHSSCDLVSAAKNR